MVNWKRSRNQDTVARMSYHKQNFREEFCKKFPVHSSVFIQIYIKRTIGEGYVLNVNGSCLSIGN